MKYLTFLGKGIPEPSEYDIAFLVPRLNHQDMARYYMEPYLKDHLTKIIACELYKEKKKTSVLLQKEFLDELLPELMDLKVKYLVVCDAEYAKTLTGLQSIEPSLGYILDSTVGDFKIIYCPNYQQIFYNPDGVGPKVNQALTALVQDLAGTHSEPGVGVIHHAEYPRTVPEIRALLERLLEWNIPLSADIEGFSLKHYAAGIGTISFAWSKHEGGAFPVDLSEDPQAVRSLLRWFFEESRNQGIKIIWHNISYDVYVLVYQLFMEDLLDTQGLLYGMEVLLSNWEDTKLITYLATNSCAGNELGLKIQAQEFAGNYAVEDIKDIRKIPLDDLLQYNLIDTLSTWYVAEKHWQTMVDDDQLSIYEDIFKPAIWDIVQMQLTGLPLDMERTKEVSAILEADQENAFQRLSSTQIVEEFEYHLNLAMVEKKNSKWKKKRITIEEQLLLDVTERFNPNSPDQLQELLYDEKFLGFPVIDKTDSKLPATGKDTLKKLKSHTTDQVVLDFLDALIDYKNVSKIITAFMPHFLAAPQAPDHHHYLFGFFNIGGTVSGRLSSNGPNLQNLPANGKYAKLIKSCFKAPPGWIFCSLDFNALEDRISTVTTRDPNKVKIYTDGYDAHCLRAYAYFQDQMPDIDPNSVESINSIEVKYKPLRQKGKNPTFALTYDGTYLTLMTNYNFSEELARKCEAAYKTLYIVSIQWVQARLKQAERDGYITCAFGLRVRTPLLKQTILGNKKTPFEAAAEGRTAGNALGQSWGLLNTRAASEFMYQVRDSNYKLDIKPCAQIHDAQYYLVREDAEIIHWMNEKLVRAVQWQYDPLIAHDEVKMGGKLGIFYPDWSNELTIPNGATQQEIIDLCQSHYEEVSD